MKASLILLLLTAAQSAAQEAAARKYDSAETWLGFVDERGHYIEYQAGGTLAMRQTRDQGPVMKYLQNKMLNTIKEACSYKYRPSEISVSVPGFSATWSLDDKVCSDIK